MKILICGAGAVTRELLRRLGEAWEPTLVERSEERLARTASLFPDHVHTFLGDASSPLVLKEAGLAEQDYVLALTDNDEVNYEVAASAQEAGVSHILALVREGTNLPRFQELGVRTLAVGAVVARELHQFLEGPEVQVTRLSLGQGAVMEMEAAAHPRVVGRLAAGLRGSGWRLAGLIRAGELVLPDRNTRIEEQDRLLILGRPDGFNLVCDTLDCGMPGFPSAYGEGLMVVLWPSQGADYKPLLSEGLHWALNSRVEGTMVVCRRGLEGIDEQVEQWPAATRVRVRRLDSVGPEAVGQLCDQERIAIVVMNKLEITFLQGLAKAVYMNLAESLRRPLLLAGHTMPYNRILVPFNARARSEAALQVAVDVAHQMKTGLTLVAVEEPEFLRGGEEGSWLAQVKERVSELSHRYKLEMDLLVRRGNPVKEVVALSEEYDLMVVGGSSRGRGMLSPNIGEHLAQKAACSVLLVTV